ncbi:MAG TPA: endonuclease/exonuclease/phosphatase family protein [Candidatus Angelobacter sp.]|jgi:hypothetical protein|nr:endonuclease/exonuclease/phosphatase family protein [Candidatus Angelobacter sp.]
MLTFLFWNTDHNAVSRHVVDLAIRHDVDFVLLAECAIPPADLLQAINHKRSSYHYVPSNYERIVTLLRFSPQFTNILLDTPNLLLRRVKMPEREEFLLAAAHLPSRLWEDAASLNSECEELAKIIRDQETSQGHERTIVIGDLNLNPFEPGIVRAPGFHAVMSKRVAGRGSRVVHGRRYPFFYNPMWNYFGDENPPSGTYYYRGSGHLSYFWNIFDQVLIRPDLLHYLPDHPVNILTTTDSQPLLRGNELPDRVKVSDHLPILFTINL